MTVNSKTVGALALNTGDGLTFSDDKLTLDIREPLVMTKEENETNGKLGLDLADTSIYINPSGKLAVKLAADSAIEAVNTKDDNGVEDKGLSVKVDGTTIIKVGGELTATR